MKRLVKWKNSSSNADYSSNSEESNSLSFSCVFFLVVLYAVVLPEMISFLFPFSLKRLEDLSESGVLTIEEFS